MKLYMKQKIFSFRDKFTITDDLGNVRYLVEGQLISLGKKLHIYDPNGQELAEVRQKLLTLLPKFCILIGGQQVGEIKKRFTVLNPQYTIEGMGWLIQGSFLEHDYSITQGSTTVARIHKVWMSWGDSFEIDIPDPRDELMAIAAVLAIDVVMDAQNTASSAAASNGSAQ